MGSGGGLTLRLLVENPSSLAVESFSASCEKNCLKSVRMSKKKMAV